MRVHTSPLVVIVVAPGIPLEDVGVDDGFEVIGGFPLPLPLPLPVSSSKSLSLACPGPS
jgi:hypothetical protein